MLDSVKSHKYKKVERPIKNSGFPEYIKIRATNHKSQIISKFQITMTKVRRDRKNFTPVTPAKAGVHNHLAGLGSGVRRNDVPRLYRPFWQDLQVCDFEFWSLRFIWNLEFDICDLTNFILGYNSRWFNNTSSFMAN
jgi:hypothetical protein